MKKIILSLGLMFSSIFAIDLGVLLVSPEVGATLSYNKVTFLKAGKEESDKLSIPSNDSLGTGAYARLWLGFLGLMLAPQVKYDYLKPAFNYEGDTSKSSLHNIQYGALLGYRIPFIKLTPFAGISYSSFKGEIKDRTLKNTYAVNFGVRWEVPFIPLLVLGIEGSWQKPELNLPSGGATNEHLKMLNLGASLGFAF